MSDSRFGWATWIAITVDAVIVAAAFWLSYVALTDLARMSGVRPAEAWPIVVDGMILSATTAVVALRGKRSAGYAWLLLIVGSLVSVAANATHAALNPTDAPTVIAAVVASIPPLALLASTHLIVVLIRNDERIQTTAMDLTESSGNLGNHDDQTKLPAALVTDELVQPRHRAMQLREQGLRNSEIAKELGVHPSTIGRWLAA